jgi:ssDNA-binding Zn-finger/Zn-ribbon topoisomerase 1
VFGIPKRIATCGRGVSQQRREQTRQRIRPGGDLAPTAGRFGQDRTSAQAAARAVAGNRIRAGVRKPFLAHRPALAAEWHPTRNRGIAPNTLGLTSPITVWWRCSVCKHEWEASIKSRATSGTGCPRCFRENARRQANLLNERRVRRFAPSRSLAVANPLLAGELHPTRNADIDPDLLLAGSRKTVWWLCPTCRHEWQARVNNRSRGGGCPVCSRHLRS